jgi:2-polyprenyl-3-methyl-5-hydroxy-6-metoxy-1,4-benzoquinol methylase
MKILWTRVMKQGARKEAYRRKVLEVVQKIQPHGRLLDIGAGSGILVEQAIEMGYRAEGIEPSSWLHEIAVHRHLPVHLGSFPNPATSGPFDVITLINVIEHVPNPVELLRNIAESLSPGGTVIVVTPDVGSVAAHILSWKWWHFRVAHIGYFNKRTLLSALDRAGLQPVSMSRPGWFSLRTIFGSESIVICRGFSECHRLAS